MTVSCIDRNHIAGVINQCTDAHLPTTTLLSKGHAFDSDILIKVEIQEQHKMKTPYYQI